MSANKPVIGSDLSKVDAHVIRADEYDELPEITDEMLASADEFVGAKLIRKGGRPCKAVTKTAVSVRFSPEVVAYFRATGTGWQTRMDAALKEWIASQRA